MTTTRSTLSKFFCVELKNILINCSVLGTMLIHDLICAIISRTYAPLHKKWSFQLRVFSVNVTKSAVSCFFIFCAVTCSFFCFLRSDVRSMIISFCILLSGIIHLTSLFFGSFLIEPSWWTKHKGTVYNEYVSASSKVISRLALMDNDINFPILLLVSISFILLSFFRAFLFSTDLNENTLFLLTDWWNGISLEKIRFSEN